MYFVTKMLTNGLEIRTRERYVLSKTNMANVVTEYTTISHNIETVSGCEKGGAGRGQGWSRLWRGFRCGDSMPI
jgi:hypothetical protein